MTTTEFIPGVFYPNEMISLLPPGSSIACADITTKGKRPEQTTHFTVTEKIVTEPPKPKLPTVPEFLKAMAMIPEDIFVSNSGYRHRFSKICANVSYPIRTGDRSWTREGWYFEPNEGDKDCPHIIRIERNGVTVAEGQVYDE
jgi:hypothetical protein